MKKLRQILISNDDGLGSPFLGRFLEAFSSVAESLVCVVPAEEQSWIGRAYSRHKTLTLKEREIRGNAKIYTVDGTPADCVNIALGHLLDEKPDAVVSGINIGHNLALPLLWSSGTFAAAVEGAAMGCPSFACSLQLAYEYYEICRLRHEPPPNSLDEILKAACTHASEFVRDAIGSETCEPFTVFNMNYPADFSAATEFKMCEPAKVMVRPLHNPTFGGKFEFKYAIGEDMTPEGVLTDIRCMKNSWGCFSKIKIV